MPVVRRTRLAVLQASRSRIKLSAETSLSSSSLRSSRLCHLVDASPKRQKSASMATSPRFRARTISGERPSDEATRQSNSGGSRDANCDDWSGNSVSGAPHGQRKPACDLSESLPSLLRRRLSKRLQAEKPTDDLNHDDDRNHDANGTYPRKEAGRNIEHMTQPRISRTSAELTRALRREPPDVNRCYIYSDSRGGCDVAKVFLP
jgi:hypothetical protein